ncbi:MAG TPA: hypothetical protein VF534_09705 [Paraburkholderia sp.]
MSIVIFQIIFENYSNATPIIKLMTSLDNTPSKILMLRRLPLSGRERGASGAIIETGVRNAYSITRAGD